MNLGETNQAFTNNLKTDILPEKLIDNQNEDKSNTIVETLYEDQ